MNSILPTFQPAFNLFRIILMNATLRKWVKLFLFCLFVFTVVFKSKFYRHLQSGICSDPAKAPPSSSKRDQSFQSPVYRTSHFQSHLCCTLECTGALHFTLVFPTLTPPLSLPSTCTTQSELWWMNSLFSEIAQPSSHHIPVPQCTSGESVPWIRLSFLHLTHGTSESSEVRMLSPSPCEIPFAP